MKKSEKQAWLQRGLGLLAGLVIAGSVNTVTSHNDHRALMKKLDQQNNSAPAKSKSHEDMTMAEMTESLKDETGDEFDQAFTEMMIVHHQGAVDMAELALTNAKHDEIKALANNIITTQNKEIHEMHEWHHDWGYNDETMH